MSRTRMPLSALESIKQRLVGLKMARSLEVVDDLVSQLEQKQLSALEAIDLLLAEEFSTRESRRIKIALLTARLTQIKTLESFDFSFQPSLDRNQILALAELGFVDRKEVVHFLGPPGTGKSHLAIALGYEAIKQGKSVYLATLAEIIASLIKAEREGTLVQRIRFLTRAALLIIDEVGYLPLEKAGANLFFQLVNARYEKGAMILTSNRSFQEWGEIFGDNVVAAALLDRLLILRQAAVIKPFANVKQGRPYAEIGVGQKPRLQLGLNPPDSTERPTCGCGGDRSRERRGRAGLLAPEAESRLAARNRPSRGCWRPFPRPAT